MTTYLVSSNGIDQLVCLLSMMELDMEINVEDRTVSFSDPDLLVFLQEMEHYRVGESSYYTNIRWDDYEEGEDWIENINPFDYFVEGDLMGVYQDEGDTDGDICIRREIDGLPIFHHTVQLPGGFTWDEIWDVDVDISEVLIQE